ncbi:MBG domain-containing protein [Novosphingobium sp. KN65.2]|uniref:MBG domain-containing protein n=1 Tax=Novosphingobium sp. KN65.2 TaxID=1478134 RepID=UPI0005E27643|nr:MBG domain-containing protein [Novosphingobium sp. KN65.2]CDO36499.1 putative large exoprotein [Novosphingobium sp. KN65.2]
MRPRSSLSLLRNASLVALLAAMPQVVWAQAFQGTGTVDFGSATIDSSVAGVDNITVDSAHTTITWTPTDTGTGGGAINFLASGDTVNFAANGALGSNYVVLNRIVPVDQTRAVRLDGNITSDAAGSVWFYSPGGLLVGSTARIDVGSLLLTTGDPVVDGTGDFMPTAGQFSIGPQSGSTSAIVVEAGVEVRSENVGQNNYIVAVAPRIQQDGLLSARGSVALVAAESADFAIDNTGLFNISVTSGSGVSTNTFTHTGSTGGPDIAGVGETRRVYMVAVPKNNAITMAIESSGSIGFDVAGAASLDGNTIVLSAGHNIADSGSGNPIAVGPASSGTADISIARGSYTSNGYVSAVGNVTVTDMTAGGTPDISFASNLSIHANNAAILRAEQGTISIGGDLVLEADAGSTGAGSASLEAGLAGTAVNIGGNLLVSASEINTSNFYATGGAAQLLSDGGLITVGGSAVVAANAIGFDTGIGSGGSANGGSAIVTIGAGGGLLVSGGSLTVDASAKGGAAGDGSGDLGGDAYGGFVKVETTGGTIGVAGTLAIGSSAIAGDAGLTNGTGGEALAYQAPELLIQGAITTGGLSLDARVKGGSGSSGGNAYASSPIFTLSPGSMLTVSGDALFDTSAHGGDGAVGTGGYAVAGNVKLAVGDSAATIDLQSNVGFNASAIGGNSASAAGGAATGGTVLLAADAGTFKLASTGGSLVFDTSVQAGTGTISGVAQNGFTLFSAASNATASLGTGGGSPGDIVINAPITVGGNSHLKILAAGSIDVAGTVTGSGANAHLTLQADSDGNAAGTVTAQSGLFNLTGTGNQIDIYYNPASFGTPTDFSGSVVAGNLTAYQLVYTLADLQGINNFLGQNFALGTDIDASATIGWNGGAGFVPLGTGSQYTGNFDGLGHVITNLTINRPGVTQVGLFALAGGPASQPAISIRNVGLINASIIGGDSVGGLIGATANCGFCGAVKVSNSFVTGTVTGQSNVGGLIGGTGMNTFVDGSHSTAAVIGSGSRIGGLIGGAYHAVVTRSFSTGIVSGADNSTEVGGLIGWHDYGSIDQSYSSGDVVVGAGAQFVGGLTGTNWVSVSRSYALGDVIAGSGSDSIGGLVGRNIGPGYGTISASYSTGAVIAQGGTNVGGFVGDNAGGVISSSYWDGFTSGLSAGIGANTGTITNLLSVTGDPSQSGAGNYAFGSTAYANLNPNDWIWIKNATRPIGIWEQPQFQSGVASIGSIHQMQLVSLALERNYRLSHNIDATETARLSGVWGQDGFIPLGDGEPPFLGVFDGAGHVISGLAINRPSESEVGLFRYNAGTIRDLGLVDVNILGGLGWVGAIAGGNSGTITGSFVTGVINSGGSDTGGLVGMNQSTGIIDNSWSGVNVSGGNYIGGIAGSNDGSISFTFANGVVTGAGAGGLVGSNSPSGSILNSYWDSEASGVSVACSIDGGTSCANAGMLTTAQSRLASSFAGWSLDTTGTDTAIWRIYDGLSTPLLKAFLRPLVVGPTDTTLVYDGTVPLLNAIPLGADLNHLFGTAGISGAGRNAGSYSVSYSGGLSSDQLGYNIITAPAATLTITPAALTLNAVTDGRIYDATILSSGSVGIVGLQGADSISGLTQSFDSANAGTRTLSVDTGYTINDGNGGGNYTVSFNTASGSITPAALVLSAVSDTRTYDATVGSTGSIGISGLQGADSIGGLTQSFDSANAGTRTLSVDTGYTINDGNGGGNYTVSFNTASGSITPAAATITYTANPVSSAYGDALAGLTGTESASGLFGSDTLATVTTGTAVYSTSASALSNVGNYAVTGSGLSGNSANYSFSFVQDPTNAIAHSVIARAITVNGDLRDRLYGDANPILTYTVGGAGLVNGDTLTGSLSTAADTLSGVGSYAVTQGTLAASSNYALTYVDGSLSVTPRSLIISADPASRVQFDPNPALTYTVGGDGLVNGDSLAGALTTTATIASPAGSYPITQGTLAASSNYTVTYTGNDLTVLRCSAANGCTGSTVPTIANQVSSSVQQQEQSAASQTEEEQKEQAAAESTGNPKVVVNSVIDTRKVSQPPPVDEPVSGTGNSSLWIPGDL